ncbi:TonB-dependent siderophore receptor [Salinisphaera orenii]|uniref:Iron transporter n=1 Tax=Salinisphaera orenii YIM 95161 TaxID=1051139 RepID=A0A423PXA4_9GAMM|nr:TonB-dependent siderophore receptor [Salinisphaera halophila]ROO30253.1 iron transporter [Salinisphaera halophila YIM 95161]
MPTPTAPNTSRRPAQRPSTTLRKALTTLPLVLFAAGAAAQSESGETRLAPINVEGAGVDSAYAPVDGYVAERSATATKTDIPLIESPQAVSVIGREQLEDRDADTLTEAVEYSPGIAVLNRFNNNIIDSIGINIRGFQASDATYRDGTRLFAGLPYDAPIEPYGLERIEVLRGPASVLYGQGQPGGIINLVTKRPTATPLREIGLEMGSDHHKQLKGDVSGPIDEDGHWRYRLTGLMQDAESPINFIEDDRVYIAPALTWAPSARTELTVLADYQKNESDYYWTGFPRAGTAYDSDNGRIPEDRYIGIPGLGGYESEVYSVGYLFEQLIGDRITFRQNARYRHIDYDVVDVFRDYFANPDDPDDPLYPLNEDLTQLSRDARLRFDEGDTLTVDNQLVTELSHGNFDHSVLVGFDYKTLDYEARNSGFRNPTTDIPPLDLYDPDYSQDYALPTTFTRSRTEADQYGLYVQDHVKYGDHWAFTAGARQDWVKEESLGADENDQNNLSWRAGLVYLADNGLAPYASYSESFTPQYGVNEATGASYEPISGEQYEIGLRYRPIGWNASFEIAAFDISRENELVALPSNPTVQDQIGETRSRGVELGAEIDLTRGLSAIASYTWNEVEVVEAGGAQATNGKRVVDRPEHIAKLWLDYEFQRPVLDGLGMGAGVRHRGSAFSNADNTARYPSATLVDAAVRYTFDNVRLQVSARNVFDDVKVYCTGNEPSSFCDYGVGRNVLGSITYRWD